MNIFEIITLLFGGGILLAACRLLFISGKIVQKIDTMGENISEVKAELKTEIDEVKKELKSLGEKIQRLDSRVARIEGQLIGPPHFYPRLHEKQEEE